MSHAQPVNRPIPVPPDPAAITALVDSSIKPGASVFLVFHEGTLNVFLDRLGDWTITVAMASRSTKLLAVDSRLQDESFFKAAEQDGKIYYMWTSTLLGILDGRKLAEEKLLAALKILQTAPRVNYIA